MNGVADAGAAGEEAGGAGVADEEAGGAGVRGGNDRPRSADDGGESQTDAEIELMDGVNDD